MSNIHVHISFGCVQINPFNGDVVLSERAAYMKEVMLPKVQPGDVLDCVVANLVPFGAFVHVAGPDGRHHGAQVGSIMFHLCQYISTPPPPHSRACRGLACAPSQQVTHLWLYIQLLPSLTRMHMCPG